MDAQYAPMAAAKRKKAVVPLGVVVTPSKLGGLAQRNLRFRELFQIDFWRSRNAVEVFMDATDLYLLSRRILSGCGSDEDAHLLRRRFCAKGHRLADESEAEQRIGPTWALVGTGTTGRRCASPRKGSFHIFGCLLCHLR